MSRAGADKPAPVAYILAGLLTLIALGHFIAFLTLGSWHFLFWSVIAAANVVGFMGVARTGRYGRLWRSAGT
jgi:hypothetical protein